MPWIFFFIRYLFSDIFFVQLTFLWLVIYPISRFKLEVSFIKTEIMISQNSSVSVVKDAGVSYGRSLHGLKSDS